MWRSLIAMSAASVFASTAFAQLSPHKAVDILDLVRTLQASPPPTKREFETSSTYQTRLLQWRSKALPASDSDSVLINLNPDGVICEGVSIAYDADRAAWTVIVGKSFASLLLKNRALGTFKGSNAFGVQRTVSIVEQVTVGLKGLSLDGETLMIPMDVRRARELKGNISILATAKLVAPYLETDRSTMSATVASPVEVREVINTISVDWRGMFAIDRRTGEVLGRQEGSSKKPEPSFDRHGSYLSRVRARILPHLVLTSSVSGSPVTFVEILLDSSGGIKSSKIAKPSGWSCPRITGHGLFAM